MCRSDESWWCDVVVVMSRGGEPTERLVGPAHVLDFMPCVCRVCLASQVAVCSARCSWWSCDRPPYRGALTLAWVLQQRLQWHVVAHERAAHLLRQWPLFACSW